MRDPVFALFLVGRFVSTAGVWVFNIVAVILAFEISQSVLVVGLVSVAQFGPQLLLAPLSGAVADRGDRLAQLIVGRMVVVAGAGALSVWTLLVGTSRLETWPILLISFVVGLGFVVTAPAQNALIPSLAHRDDLAAAIALNTIPPTLARAGGPAIGSLAAATLGPGLALAIAAAANLVSAVLWMFLKIPSESSERTDTRDIWGGFRYVRGHPALILLLFGVVAIGIGTDPATTLSPSLAARFRGGPRVIGLLTSAFGIGSVLSLIAIPLMRDRLHIRDAGATGLAAMAFGIAVAGFSPSLPLAVGALAIAGMGMTVALTGLSTQIQERIPDAVRGRIMAIWSIAFVGSRPVAAALNGAIADGTSPVFAFIITAAVVAAASWVCRPGNIPAQLTLTDGT